jgi:hypothetical protein
LAHLVRRQVPCIDISEVSVCSGMAHRSRSDARMNLVRFCPWFCQCTEKKSTELITFITSKVTYHSTWTKTESTCECRKPITWHDQSSESCVEVGGSAVTTNFHVCYQGNRRDDPAGPVRSSESGLIPGGTSLSNPT